LKKMFLGVLLAGLLWRLVLSFLVVPAWEARTGVASTPDAYPVLARSLVDEGVFGYGSIGASPTTVRGPGFPLWLAASTVVGGGNVRWLAFWGGLPGLLVGAWLASLVAGRWGTVGGLVTGAVAVFHPLPSLIAARGMGDDFYGALGAAALVTWVAATASTHPRRGLVLVAAAGLLLAVQILARSSGVLTLAVAVLCAALWRRSRSEATPTGGELALRTALLVVLALLPALFWSIRSSRLEGRPVFVHSLGAYNFWIGEGFDRFGTGPPPSGNYPQIVEYALSQAGAEFRNERFWYASLEPRQAARLDAELGQAARRRVFDEPVSYLRRVLRGIPAYWVRAQTKARSVQYAIAVVPILLLAALGLRRGLADPLGLQLFLLLVAHNLVYAAVLPMARMSVQVYPALAVLAGIGAATVMQRIRGR
jgi:hypothetical protein